MRTGLDACEGSNIFWSLWLLQPCQLDNPSTFTERLAERELEGAFDDPDNTLRCPKVSEECYYA